MFFKTCSKISKQLFLTVNNDQQNTLWEADDDLVFYVTFNII